MFKTIVEKKEMEIAIKAGMNKIASIVKRTLGVGGLPIILERKGQSLDGSELSPIITKDGVTVAENCQDEDEKIDVVIQSVKDMCTKTNKVAGDGPQPLYSKILTPNGFITMGEVKPGMSICGTSGTLQSVINIYPKGLKKVFKVKFSDGRVVECCDDHLWAVTTNWGTQKVLPLKEIRENLFKVQVDGSPKYTYYVPHNIVEFESNRNLMPLDPYLVGVLIGDGSLSGTGTLEISLGKAKEHILNKLVLPEGIYLESKWIDNKNYFRVKINGKTSDKKSMKDFLISVGLWEVKSNSKRIPEAYIYSSKKDREALLQGLLDTDGYINKRNRFEFSTISYDLATDFISLIRSLNKQTTLSLHTRDKDPDSYSNNPIFRMYERKGYKYGIQIIDVEETDILTEMQCIKVSNPDNLYITDDFVVTHNTTTAIVLGEAILNEAFKELDEDPNLNPQLVRESIEEVAKEVISKLKEQAIEVKDTQIVEDVAVISANGDREIGRIIKQAFDAVGCEGVITVDEGHSNHTTINIVEGFQIKRGAEAQDRFFNNQENTKFEAENVHVILYNGALRAYTDLLPAFKAMQDELQKQNINKMPPILIVADEFTQEVIQWFLINRAEAGVSICAIKSPHVSDIRTAMMDDMACVLGGERLGNGNRSIQATTFEDIGIAGRVIVDKYTTTFFDGQGEEQAVIDRIDSLKARKAVAESPYDEQLIADRIAALANGVAIIGVGGTTEMEIKERYHRIEDALNAARAAMEEGVIPGGGIALAKIADRLETMIKCKRDKRVGSKILSKALKAPFYQIVENVGENGPELFTKLRGRLKANKNVVYDARKKKVVYAMKAGIVDPVKVCRTALENAISISSLLCTCGGAVVFTRKK